MSAKIDQNGRGDVEQTLQKASEQYEEYLQLNKIGQLTSFEEEDYSGASFWGHPLTLTIETLDSDALLE